MFTIIYGTDRDKVVERLAFHVRDISHDSYDAESFDQGVVQQLLSGGGLFGGAEMIVFQRLLISPETQEFFETQAGALKESGHTFIALEDKLTKKQLSVFEKNGVIIEEYNLPAPPKNDPSKFNMFSLTDAFGLRDKKNLWILFQEALAREVPIEEIHGVLWWQLKNMLLVAEEKTNPGLHSFAYGKVQKAVQKYSMKELQDLSEMFITSFHEVRTGKKDLERELEKMILGL
jgi:hypothetical protein